MSVSPALKRPIAAAAASSSPGPTTPKTPPSSARFSSKSPRAGSSYGSPGGTTLLVDSIATRKPSSPSASFRSTTSIGDAHIRALSSQINKVPFKAAPPDHMGKRSTVVAFGATGSNERDAHYRELLKRTGGNTQGKLLSWGAPGGQCSPTYRSKSPIACAHINALHKPYDASYVPASTPTPHHEMPSACYRSNSSIADAHIRALNKPRDNTSAMSDISKGIHSPVNASFRSKGSIADAHIKALPKPADMCVAYREY